MMGQEERGREDGFQGGRECFCVRARERGKRADLDVKRCLRGILLRGPNFDGP